jgi:hypothetical protein
VEAAAFRPPKQTLLSTGFSPGSSTETPRPAHQRHPDRRRPRRPASLRPLGSHPQIAAGDPVEAAAFRPPKQRQLKGRALARALPPGRPSASTPSRSETAPTPSPSRVLATSSSSPTPAPKTSPSSALPAAPLGPPQNRSTLHHAPRRQTRKCHCRESLSDAVAWPPSRAAKTHPPCNSHKREPKRTASLKGLPLDRASTRL